jgi:hypothetical protein
VQADPEHQQHHADFGQLAGQHRICHEARRGRADDAGRQIADQRRQFEARGDIAEQQPGPVLRRWW